MPNPGAISSRLQELGRNGAHIYLLMVINLPQIFAGFWILSSHWSDTSVCDQVHRNRWRLWSSVAATRLIAHTVLVSSEHLFRNYLRSNPMHAADLTRYRAYVDAFGLAWFVLGNMWLLGDDPTCEHPGESHVYTLCLVMLVINYIQICLPCILAVMMIPIFCFCMPCLIRLLARLQHLSPTKGASEAVIDTLPTVTVNEATLEELQDITCPVCLSDLVVGDEARRLPCAHHFHKSCVDEWLKVNATCPTCRQTIHPEAAQPTSGSEEGDDENDNNNDDDDDDDNDDDGVGGMRSAARLSSMLPGSRVASYELVSRSDDETHRHGSAI